MFWLSKLSLTTNLFIYTGIQQVLVTLLNQSMTFKNTKKKTPQNNNFFSQLKYDF
jgi:hypothetical protein